jgi:hypothetical protein
LSEQATYTTFGPKGKILTTIATGTGFTARLKTDARINWITIYNTGAITVNVTFEESGLNPLPVPASTSLELDVWRMLSLNVQTIDFSSASSTTINLIWAEGPSPLVLFGRR